MQGKELSETTKLAQICSRRLWGGGMVGVGGGWWGWVVGASVGWWSGGGGVVGVGLWKVL